MFRKIMIFTKKNSNFKLLEVFVGFLRVATPGPKCRVQSGNLVMANQRVLSLFPRKADTFEHLSISYEQIKERLETRDERRETIPRHKTSLWRCGVGGNGFNKNNEN
jgi:hypothetical protein